MFDCVGEIDSGFNSCESRRVPCKSCVAKRLELGSSSTEFGTRVLSIDSGFTNARFSEGEIRWLSKRVPELSGDMISESFSPQVGHSVTKVALLSVFGKVWPFVHVNMVLLE